MSAFLRLSLIYFAALAIAIIAAVNVFYGDIKPSLRQASEESMVESANLMAEMVSPYLQEDTPKIEELNILLQRFQARRPNANIWSHQKQKTALRLYITDHLGTVLYHSTDRSQIGKDYAQWRDVKLTLDGQYGARTTKADASNELSSEMYVAAPILKNGQITGVLTLIQPNQGIQPFIGQAQTRILFIGASLLFILMGLGLLLTTWFNRMLSDLTHYVEQIRHSDSVKKLHFKDPGFNQLANTLHKMREELDGKAYIEQYIHTLTHELKTPLSAISAAAQILEGDLDKLQKQKFLHNIEAEVERLKQLIEKLLFLASLENRQQHSFTSVNISEILAEETESLQALLSKKQLSLNLINSIEANTLIEGDDFLLHTAIRNLLDNAIDFSSPHSTLKIELNGDAASLHLCICNQGEHIPDYALPQIFDRFFSTPRPDSGRKSSGLGLCLIKEIAHIHGGNITLENIEYLGEKNVKACLTLSLNKINKSPTN